MRTSPYPLPSPVKRAVREFGAHVQAWRKLRGLTQTQLAERAGVDRKTVIRVERSDTGVSMENVFRILHALGVLEGVPRAVDPYETDLGRLRADDQLPQRVRPREMS